MSKQPFDVPQLTIGRVYTRGGDEGETGLAGGQRNGIGLRGCIERINFAVLGRGSGRKNENNSQGGRFGHFVKCCRYVHGFCCWGCSGM